MMLMYHTMFGIVDGRLHHNMGNCSIQFFCNLIKFNFF